MTLSELFIEMAQAISSRTSEIRAGQAAFNYLYSVRPDIANIIRNTTADPFHQDGRMSSFYKAIIALWE